MAEAAWRQRAGFDFAYFFLTSRAEKISGSYHSACMILQFALQTAFHLFGKRFDRPGQVCQQRGATLGPILNRVTFLEVFLDLLTVREHLFPLPDQNLDHLIEILLTLSHGRGQTIAHGIGSRLECLGSQRRGLIEMPFDLLEAAIVQRFEGVLRGGMILRMVSRHRASLLLEVHFVNPVPVLTPVSSVWSQAIYAAKLAA
jgi:hypothetical protein